MYSKSLLASAALLSAATSVTAHALIAPPLGVTGTPNRGNVGRPSNGKECGNANVAGSQAVNADASGAFSVTGQSFNGGQDGATQVTMTIDTTGKGNGAKFAQIGAVTTNGNPNPKGAENGVAIKATLGAGTKCTGPGNTCVVAFKTAGGFGNCVLVKQGGGAGAAAAAPAAPAAAPAKAPAAAPAPAKAPAAAAAGKKTAKKGGKKGGKKGVQKKVKGVKKVVKVKAKAAAPAVPQGAAAANVDARFSAARKAAGVKVRELDTRAILTRAPRMVRARSVDADELD